ncbi:MAG: BatA domain-containing protein, partial [Pirellulales bacterium]|nr:BatA domain-containing protein [Pirellulales bacterium]
MGLSFLNIMLLSGMAVIAIPVLLHLLMRRKPVPHQFPAIRFLQARSQIKKRRLKLQHLLLLLVRVLALCILVLAVSRPILRGAGWIVDQEGPVAVACVVDTAPRMLLRQGNRTR